MTPLSKRINAIAEPEEPLGISITTSVAPAKEVFSGKSGAAAGPERWKRMNAKNISTATAPAAILFFIFVAQFQVRNLK